jgi:hypothetical protein
MLHVLPLSYRQRALAQIEALIAQAERDVARHNAARAGKTKRRTGRNANGAA